MLKISIDEIESRLLRLASPVLARHLQKANAEFTVAGVNELAEMIKEGQYTY